MRTQHLVLALVVTLLAIPAAAAVTGIVMTPEGQPLAGARVLVQAIETPDQRMERLLSAAPDIVPLSETQTDAKGAFSLPSPKEAVADLRIELKGAEPFSRRIERDEDLGAVVIMRREMQKGTVTAGGRPVANALVVVSYQGEYATRTDEQGRYEVPDVKRANRITVIHPDFAIDEEAYSFPGGASAGELKRTLQPGTSLTGRAVGANGTSPVAGAEILVDGWPLGMSGEDGTFTISRAPAQWSALVARKGTQAGYRAAGADKTITVRLEKNAVVSGRVADAKTKVPIAGVTVRMFVPRMPAAGDPSLIAQTDEKGVYAISSPPGTYMLTVSHPAYGAESQNITVTPGQQASKDLSLHQLARVSGIVVDEERRPVAAAAVAGGPVTREMAFRMMRVSRNMPVLSGPDGRFSLRVQPDSDFQLIATKRGLPQVKGETLKLAPGERKGSVVLTIPSGVAVTGRALDQNGDPLSGVTVSATETPQGDRGAMMTMIFAGGMPGEEEDLVRTTSDGSFVLRVKEGTYDFTFKREGYAPKSVRAQSITANGENTVEIRLDPAVEISGRVSRAGVGVPDVQIRALSSAEAVATTGPDGAFSLGGLSPGVTRLMLRKEADLINEQRSFTAPARDLVIDLPEGGTIRGRVVEKGTKKAIASFQAGVATSRSGAGMISMAPPQLKSFTSEDGSFTLEHVPPGTTSLIAAAPGYAGSRMNVEVENGKSLDDVVLELDKGVRLTGKVTGADGSPLSDATVLVTPSPGGAFAMSGSVPRATTDANGEYSLEALLPGEETVQASHPKHVETSRKVTLKGPETKLDLQLAAGARITGVVVTEDGMPVAEAFVSASSGGRPREARTNASGSFEIDSISPGRYRFTASKSGFADGVVEDVDVSSGAPVRIALKTGGTIYGRVTGLQEAEYAKTTVNASAGRSFSSAAVDPQGNFKMEGAPVGTARVWASLSAGGMGGSRSTSQQTVDVAPGSSQQVTLEFGGNTLIEGQVTRNGSAVPGAAVGFFPKQGSSSTSGTGSGLTDESGRYSISGLEPGEYNVSVRDLQRFSAYSTTYTVRGSDTFDIAYTAGSVRGRVLNASTNEPINGATVQLRPTSASTESWMNMLGATSDSSGTFSIELVPAGSYSLTAGVEGFANQILETTIGNAGRDDLEIKLMRNDGVRLKIVDGRDGRQLNGSAVAFDAQGRVVHDGRMVRFFGGSSPEELTLQLSPGTYSVTVTAPNYAPRTIAVTSPSTPTVSLTPGGTIRLQSKHSERRRFRLLDASGWQYPRWDARQMPGTLQPGTTPLSNIAPGNYTVQLLNENESIADQVQVTVREGEIVDVSI